MAVTSTRLTTSLAKQLHSDFPAITFTAGDIFMWSPQNQQVTYVAGDNCQSLLHETAHALLHHSHFSRDIELLDMERQAWDHAREIAPRYGISIAIDTVEGHLDTYRSWMHKRSLCPRCNLNGIQTSQQQYSCLSCHHVWRVNDARSCRLERTLIT